MALAGSFLPIIAMLSDPETAKTCSINAVIEAEHGFTLLHGAAYHSNGKAVYTLLKMGADPN